MGLVCCLNLANWSYPLLSSSCIPLSYPRELPNFIHTMKLFSPQPQTVVAFLMLWLLHPILLFKLLFIVPQFSFLLSARTCFFSSSSVIRRWIASRRFCLLHSCRVFRHTCHTQNTHCVTHLQLCAGLFIDISLVIFHLFAARRYSITLNAK